MVSLLRVINDTHCHFFSTQFFATLSQQRGKGEPPAALCTELEWDDPGEPEALADRWVARARRARREPRAAIIASVPGDEASVAAAVARHPTRFVGYFMVNAAAPDAVARTHAAVSSQRLRCLCLFPAMHHTPLDDDRVKKVVEAAAGGEAAVFIHCGELSVGVRRALGLPSPFDLRLGDPLGVARLAATFPTVPFIIPHFGAGLLREALMAADACPNIYLDTSSSNRWIRFTPGLTLVGRLPRGARRRRVRTDTVRHRLVVFSARLAAGRVRGTARGARRSAAWRRPIRTRSSAERSIGCFRRAGLQTCPTGGRSHVRAEEQ